MPRNRERWRALALTAVLLGHTAVILVVVRADRDRRIADAAAGRTALRLIRLPARILESPPRLPAPTRSSGRTRSPLPPPLDLAPFPAVIQPLPRIDWARAAELAAQNGVAELEQQARYRDLAALSAALSPAQREWLKQQQLEPVAPGIRWAPARVEVTPEGLPIIHVNDHCIVIPMLAFLMFCHIGHIEANGHLFDHMRDARPH